MPAKPSPVVARVRVVVVADDLGICDERDRGIFESLDNGIVTCAVVLPNGDTSGAACDKARQRGYFARGQIGLHLNVSEGRPLSNPHDVASLLHWRGLSGTTGTKEAPPQFVGMRELQRRFEQRKNEVEGGNEELSLIHI